MLRSFLTKKTSFLHQITKLRFKPTLLKPKTFLIGSTTICSAAVLLIPKESNLHENHIPTIKSRTPPLTATIPPSHPLSLLFRAIQLFFLFGPPLLLLPITYITNSCRSILQDWFIWSLQTAGPTFIKLGQWLSTRPDIFPREFCLKLSHFHDSVPTEPFTSSARNAIVAAVVQAQAQDSSTITPLSSTAKSLHLHDIYTEFDPIPIGSGCVSQVYLARLQSSNQRVVIKVKRQDVDQRITDDLALLTHVTSWIEYIFPSMQFMSLSGCVSEFSSLLLSQLDLKQEGRHLLQFDQNFTRTWNAHENECIHFPKPYLNLSSKDVLVETYEEGISLSEWLQEREKAIVQGDTRTSKQSIIEATIADIGARSFFEMVLVHNFIHSDLHPGNILISKKSNRKNQNNQNNQNDTKKMTFFGSFFGTEDDPVDDSEQADIENDICLIYLDVGLTTVLRSNSRINFISLFSAVLSGRGKHAAELMVNRSIDPSSVVDMKGFVHGMTNVIEDAVQRDANGNGFNLGKVRIGEVLLEVMHLCQLHHVRVDDTMAQLVSSIALLDGIGRQLDPTRDLFDTARPVLSKLWHLHPDYRKAIGEETKKMLF